MYKFADVFEFQKKSKIKAGDGKESGRFPFYTSSAELSKCVDNALFDGESLVFGTGGNASVHFEGGKFSVSTDCLVAQPKTDNINPKYVYHYLFGNIRILEEGFKGAGLKHISKGYISDIDLPKIPRPRQDKIVSVLDQADTLRQKRKEQLALLDDYLKSVFIDMFGEYFYDKEFCKPIKDITKFIDYRGKTPQRSEVGVPLISAKCVRQGYFDESRIEYVEEHIFDQIMTRGFPRANEVLFTTEGATMGFVTRIPKTFKRFAVGQRLITLRCTEHTTPEYLDYVLNDGRIQQEVFSRSTGSAAKGIRAREFEKILIPVAPRNLQDKFSDIVSNVEQTKQKMHASLDEMDNHFNAHMQRYFG